MNIHLGISDNDLVDLKQRIDKASSMRTFGVDAKLAVPIGLLKCLVEEYEGGRDAADEATELRHEVTELKGDLSDAEKLEKENGDLRARIDELELRLRAAGLDAA